MQESLAELAYAAVPLVVLNMARAQGDYWQATRGPGHGDARMPVLAPMDVPEATELTQLAFHLAARWRNPVLLFGDYYLAHTSTSVTLGAARPRHRSRPTTGRSTGPPVAPAGRGCCRRSARPSATSAAATTSRSTTARCAERGPRRCWPGIETAGRDRRTPTTPTSSWSRSARPRSTCAPPSPASAAKVRGSGSSVRSRCCPSRPTPSPGPQPARASSRVYENNQGQMVDDVRLAVGRRDAGPSSSAASASTARASASRPTSTAPYLRERIQELLDEKNEKVDHA